MQHNWLTISIGAFCILWALGQFRRVHIYKYIALRSALTFTVFALVFFFVPWPKLLIFIFAILTLRALIDLLLVLAGIGLFSMYAPGGAFAEARPAMIKTKIGNTIFWALVLAITLHFSY